MSASTKDRHRVGWVDFTNLCVVASPFIRVVLVLRLWINEQHKATCLLSRVNSKKCSGQPEYILSLFSGIDRCGKKVKAGLEILWLSNKSATFWTFLSEQKCQILRVQPLKCEYFLVSSLRADSQLNIFELWTKLETLRNIYNHFLQILLD